MSQNTKPIWNTESAIELIRDIQAKFADAGLHLAFTGSVLYRGESTKDLDFIVYPHKCPMSYEDMSQRTHELLTHLGWKRIRNCQEMLQYWRSLGNDEQKWVEVYSVKHRRVDVMFLQ